MGSFALRADVETEAMRRGPRSAILGAALVLTVVAALAG